MKVQTTEGLLDRSELTVRDVVTEDENSRVIATEWFRVEQMVRRDVWVCMYRGLVTEVAGG